MRIRFSVEIRITRDRAEEPEQHEHRDTDILSQNLSHPRYIGFTPEGDYDDERR